VAQADTFRLNCTFPEGRSTSQHARYLYYLGRIDAIKLRYNEAESNLTHAIRKAPQHGALGFRQAITKLLVIVLLLKGELPERSTFRQAGLKRSLKPYFELTRAVRVGDLAKFLEVVTKNEKNFVRDGVYTLITRLRHNVIKTGVRRLSTAYSRISIKDVASKLHLETEEDAENIVAKVISDGIIAATIDRTSRFVVSKEDADTYSSTEPSSMFHKRIQFCLNIHNEAVKDLRFPGDVQKPKAEAEKDDLMAELEEDHASDMKDD